ncbi:hypothetical protein EXN66_Car010499 [Channa argus]|uniref:Uncharacterized protein n=1 Tax=Channa argus TaxID=215402 RepID=A0A6G1PXB2_CHAAH|nr:hypothetical protein EXN66_Car010499 [Channa argus]
MPTWHFFPIVCDVMNSPLLGKLRVAEPQAIATFSLYANDHGFLLWSISIPVLCFCLYHKWTSSVPPATHTQKKCTHHLMSLEVCRK